MNKLLFLFTALLVTNLYAQDPIFNPSMEITAFGVIDSPTAEGVSNIIDGDINTKFLDFELNDGIGFTVNLGGVAYIATSVEMTTANDFDVRDPQQFEVLGSNDGSTFTSIATGAIPCVSTRFYSRSFDFTNSEAYLYYRVNYTTACDPSGGTGIPSMQVAETQLFGILLGIDDVDIPSKLSLYPNPNLGVFTFSFAGFESLTTAIISDISGKIIKQYDLSNFDGQLIVEMTNAASGLYFMRIIGTENATIKRFIIQ